MKPTCSNSVPSSSATLDHLTAMMLRNRLPSMPEASLFEWLGLMAGDQRSSLRELGTKISIALQEVRSMNELFTYNYVLRFSQNTTSWILATAAALYWRVIGNTEEAITCLRQALTYVPSDMKDIPLISLANVLHRLVSTDNLLYSSFSVEEKEKIKDYLISPTYSFPNYCLKLFYLNQNYKINYVLLEQSGFVYLIF